MRTESTPSRPNGQDPELRAWVDLFAGVPAELARTLELEPCAVAGGVALVAPAVDSLLFNRALEVDPERLAEVVGLFEQRGVGRYMIALPPDASDAYDEPAAELGLARFNRSWIRLGCRPRAQVSAPEGFELRPARPADGEAFAALYCAGFDVPEAAAPILAGLIGRPRWHVYVATDAGELVGLGISYLDRSHAYLFGGVTSPGWRCRGVQQALVAARVNHAHRCGASSVSADTGAPVPGRANHSQRNLERAGLRTLHLREHLIPRGTTWTGSAGEGAQP